MKILKRFYFLVILSLHAKEFECQNVSREKSGFDGPGVNPHLARLPCNYFTVTLRDDEGKLIKSRLEPGRLKIELRGKLSADKGQIGVKPEVFDRGDGHILVRFKIYRTFEALSYEITLDGEHLPESPMRVQPANTEIFSSECDCPLSDFDSWMENYGCEVGSEIYDQIDEDLEPFDEVDVYASYQKAKKAFSPSTTSICHYVIYKNEIHRDCFGQHVDFHIFVDAVLLYLTKIVVLPNTEFIVNLGDWPLVHKNKFRHNPYPIISWCKTRDHLDMLWPTYELTQASLECMGRQVLDMISVQGKSAEHSWEEKVEKAFFRGRDSNQARLELVSLAANHAQELDIGITNYFFFRDQEKALGKADRVSFFDYFKHKYQVSIDGTVAAYRLPFLLCGNSLVLKHDSDYVEHFYKMLKPFHHYVPFNVSNLLDVLHWAKDNDDQIRNIVSSAQDFSLRNLMPHNVFCYHALFISKWTERIKRPEFVRPGMTKVSDEKTRLFPFECHCEKPHKPTRDEL